jgi:hypothetical protein
MFELTKWYFDVVDPAGRSAIAYWTEMRCGPAAVRWESLSLHQPGTAPSHRSAIGISTGPVRLRRPDCPDEPGVIRWNSRALSCDIECKPWTRRFVSRLFESNGESLDWSCEAPAATVTMNPAGLAGDGYAECLTLSVPPWKLPISELRWGRWSCAATRRSIVWIDWRGRQPLTLVLVDGAPEPGARVHDDRILFESSELSLAGSRTLHARTLGEMVGGLGPIASRFPASWRGLEDRKWLSTGTLRRPIRAGLQACASPADTGWAIHETVRFP